ncbi:hypothetical protein EAH76_14575 [Sphingomonas glacialis]|uniref:Uncharacterized protein n=1 Tax=Sphingomonas glacialis TaxID=658225 RepID=A0A502FQY3_9SPHN|nr:hypothetical protein EAH76_14575 [Sphingomonas glacialis]
MRTAEWPAGRLMTDSANFPFGQTRIRSGCNYHGSKRGKALKKRVLRITEIDGSQLSNVDRKATSFAVDHRIELQVGSLPANGSINNLEIGGHV